MRPDPGGRVLTGFASTLQVMSDPIDRNLRPPEAGEPPNGRRARWRVAKPAIEAVSGHDHRD